MAATANPPATKPVPANPWLLWLDHGHAAPTTLACGALDQAFAFKHGQMKRRMARFLREGTPEAWLEVSSAWSDEQALDSMRDTLAPYQGRAAEREARAMGARWARRGGWFQRRLCQKDAAKPLRKAARLARKAGKPELAFFIGDFLECAAPSGEGALMHRVVQMATVARKKDEASARYWARNGIHLTRWPGKRNRLAMLAGRMAARAAGYSRGWLITPSGDADAWLLQHCNDAGLRQAMLAQRAKACATTWEDIDKMRALQHKRAGMFGCADTAEMEAGNAVFMKPGRVERFLHDAAATLNRRLLRVPGARAYTDADWADVRRVLGQRGGLDDTEAFPWRECAMRAIPELMEVGGWHALGEPDAFGRGAKERLRFRFRNDEGRRAEIIYAPFNPAPGAASTLGGMATLVRGADTIRQDLPRTIVVENVLDYHTQRHFDLDTLEALCHEMGHVLHYLSLPGATPMESCLLAADYDELPAMVLQNYWRDPATLNRWSVTVRRRCYWERRMRVCGMDALVAMRHTARPWLDVLMRRRSDEKSRDLCRQAQAEFASLRSLSEGEMRSVYEMEGGISAAHPIGLVLASRVCPIPDDGVCGSERVGERFRALLDRVLSRGVRPRSFLRNWSLFMGERYSVSLRRGLVSYARQTSSGLRTLSRAQA